MMPYCQRTDILADIKTSFGIPVSEWFFTSGIPMLKMYMGWHEVGRFIKWVNFSRISAKIKECYIPVS